ncbi:MAG: hypothetical protein Q4D73_04080 [Actinomycetaceae bacterium]|nr:hypothetical protein [Actinomycetaceae bacterium]
MDFLIPKNNQQRLAGVLGVAVGAVLGFYTSKMLIAYGLTWAPLLLPFVFALLAFALIKQAVRTKVESKVRTSIFLSAGFITGGAVSVPMLSGISFLRMLTVFAFYFMIWLGIIFVYRTKIEGMWDHE